MVPDGWQVEYFEKEDGRQPAEEFEDWLDRGDRDHRKIGGKLSRVADEVAQKGHMTGGGYVEKCHEAPGIWQMKADIGGRRGREFFAFDGDRAILLSGIVKESRKPTPRGAFEEAREYLGEYERTKKVSPEANDE